ncbi:cyanophycinase [Clostridium mediterraneense]|uniref:cyanophycinase n=1 Tax=Clostridium mediterraneense TaxID=1805472 RepID=UPI00082C5E6B|nr:cyanophycinase [Clostridium mediterraneense]
MEDINYDKLIIIGGAEDKEGEKTILTYVANLIKDKEMLLIATVASEEPKAVIKKYFKVFTDLGVKNIKELNINDRDECSDEGRIDLVKEAKVIFFTGGDQLRITSILGGTPLYVELRNQFENGTIYVGTSAGASVVSETMVVYGQDEESPSKSHIEMSKGLGLLNDVVIDQHFAQRGRIGRLLTAVAQNPQNIGIGIDEDTAIVIDNKNMLKVIGSGAIYIVDGRNLTYSNISEQSQNELISIFNIVLHVLISGKKYDLVTKMPFEEENLKDEDSKSKNF